MEQEETEILLSLRYLRYLLFNPTLPCFGALCELLLPPFPLKKLSPRDSLCHRGYAKLESCKN